MTQRLTVPLPIYQALMAHALREVPWECCGLLGGVGEAVQSCHPLTNRALTPQTRYFASPEDLFPAMRSLREAGETLLAIYHSHPVGDPFPSETDLELAFYPQVVYLIVGPLHPEPLADERKRVAAFVADEAMVRAALGRHGEVGLGPLVKRARPPEVPAGPAQRHRLADHLHDVGGGAHPLDHLVGDHARPPLTRARPRSRPRRPRSTRPGGCRSRACPCAAIPPRGPATPPCPCRG